MPEKHDFRQEVTDKIIPMLEQSTAPLAKTLRCRDGWTTAHCNCTSISVRQYQLRRERLQLESGFPPAPIPSAPAQPMTDLGQR